MVVCKLCGNFMRGPVAKTPCGHIFHDDCIRLHFRNSPTCPQCRSPCKDANLRSIVIGFNVVDDDIDQNDPEYDFTTDSNHYENNDDLSIENYSYKNARNTNHGFPPTSYENPTDAYEMPRENVNTYDMPPDITPTTQTQPERTYTIPELQLPTKRVRSKESLWARIFEFVSAKKCYFILGLVILLLLIAAIIVVIVLVTRKHKTTQEVSTSIIPKNYSTTHPAKTQSSSVASGLTTTTSLTQTTITNFRWPTPPSSIQSFTTPVIQTTQALPTSCPIGWNYLFLTNKCYYVGLESLSWNDSLTACQNLYPRAKLVSIHSYYENQQLVYWYNTSGDTFHFNLNIGLIYVQSVGNYTWVDGSAFDFSLAPPYQYNESCVYMAPLMLGYWGTIYCDSTNIQSFGYICELQLSNSLPTQSTFICADGWIYYNFYCYKMYNQTRDFYSAKSICENVGANLVSIQDNDENNFLASFPIMGSSELTWIGLEYTGEQWTWTDGTATFYFNWMQNNPSDSNNFPCGIIHGNMLSSSYLQWENDSCNRLYNFICKIQANSSTNAK